MTSDWIAVALVALAAVAVLSLRANRASTPAAKLKIEQGALVVDVRTPAEYASGHFAGARNIPLAELPARIAEVGDPRKPVVVYCASGMRSARAANILLSRGFADVTNAGGLRNLSP